MAKASAKQKQEKVETPLPVGFKRVNPISDISTWWKPTQGASLQGVLTGRFERKGKQKDKFYYQLKVTEPRPEGSHEVTQAVREKNEVDVEKGTVVNFDEREKLKELSQYCGQEGTYEVFIRALECIDLPGGNTMWTFDIGARLLDTDNVPF